MLSVFLLAILISLFYFEPRPVNGAKVLRVPQDYNTIQGALNAASSGDTILVGEGTYREQLKVEKSLSLIGQNKLTTIIEGNSTSEAVDVFESFVTISGFTIKSGYRGITVFDSRNTTITGNIISANTVGVDLTGANFSMVSGNIVTANNLTGIALSDAYNNTITGNIIDQNNINGIGLVYSSNNTIKSNRINSHANATKFILLSVNNTVVNNIISNNTNGIVLENPSNGNFIFHNNFVNNTKQAVVVSSQNTWDNGYPSGGNYWSDYTGVDNYSGLNQDQIGSDGIGDTPYIIDVDNRDKYPLMNKLDLITDLIPPVTKDNYDGLWHTTDFFTVLTATDDLSGVAETYYKINGGDTRNVTASGMPFITVESANDTLEYWSTDLAGNTENPHKFVINIKLDKTNPSISIITPLNGSEVTSSIVNVTWTISDQTSGISRYQVRLDSGSWTNRTVTYYDFIDVDDGNHQIYVRAFDNAGRSQIDSVKFTVNTSAARLARDLELAKWIVLPALVVIAVFIVFQYRKRRMKKRLRRRPKGP